MTSMMMMPKTELFMAKAPTTQNMQDDRHQHVARHAQDLLADLDRRPAERQHQDVGEDEDDEHRVDELRVLQEHASARDSCPSCRARRSRSR